MRGRVFATKAVSQFRDKSRSFTTALPKCDTARLRASSRARLPGACEISRPRVLRLEASLLGDSRRRDDIADRDFLLVRFLNDPCFRQMLSNDPHHLDAGFRLANILDFIGL